MSTIRGSADYPGLHTYNGKAITSGFHSHKYKIPKLTAVGYLGRLGVSFFNNITVPI